MTLTGDGVIKISRISQSINQIAGARPCFRCATSTTERFADLVSSPTRRQTNAISVDTERYVLDESASTPHPLT